MQVRKSAGAVEIHVVNSAMEWGLRAVWGGRGARTQHAVLNVWITLVQHHIRGNEPNLPKIRRFLYVPPLIKCRVAAAGVVFLTERSFAEQEK